jgi:hypothetical protein
MSDIHIDRLTLKLSGLSESEGRRLAMLIAEGLAGVTLPEGVPPRTESIRLDLRAKPAAGAAAPPAAGAAPAPAAGAAAGAGPAAGGSASVDMLAEHVVQGVLRELSRSTVSG